MTKQRNLAKYILVGFEKSKPSGVTVDYDAMTIEHLVPQSQIGSGVFTDSVVGQVGNLILVSSELNSKLDNKPFREKKRILQAANYVLPPEIASAQDWTADDIARRTEALADRAYNSVWKI